MVINVSILLRNTNDASFIKQIKPAPLVREGLTSVTTDRLSHPDRLKHQIQRANSHLDYGSDQE